MTSGKNLMYAIGNVSDRASFYGYQRTNKAPEADFSVVSGENPEQIKQEPSISTGVRQLTSVDRAVQKDLENEFGIKPWQPGDDLKDSLKTGLLAWGAGRTNSGSIDENADKALAIFQKHLQRFMLSEDIKTDPAIELDIGGDGKVGLRNDHPDREKIENFINQNSEIRNLYVGVVSAKNLVAIGKESAKFQQRYAVDPQAAVSEFAHLFSGRYQYNSSLKIGKDGWQMTTQSSFRF